MGFGDVGGRKRRNSGRFRNNFWAGRERKVTGGSIVGGTCEQNPDYCPMNRGKEGNYRE